MSSRERFAGWPEAPKLLLERACERHGGWRRFEALRDVTAELVTLGGPLPALEGLGRTFSAPARIRVAPHLQHTTFQDWPTTGQEGRYTAGAVSIARSSEVSASLDPASSHRGHMPLLGWRPEDALYFFGYAGPLHGSSRRDVARTRRGTERPKPEA